METQKTLVTKVVGNGKMHITTKNGVNIQKFAIEKFKILQNMVQKISKNEKLIE
jgi:hypothetical protein